MIIEKISIKIAVLTWSWKWIFNKNKFPQNNANKNPILQFQTNTYDREIMNVTHKAAVSRNRILAKIRFFGGPFWGSGPLWGSWKKIPLSKMFLALSIPGRTRLKQRIRNNYTASNKVGRGLLYARVLAHGKNTSAHSRACAFFFNFWHKLGKIVDSPVQMVSFALFSRFQ